MKRISQSHESYELRGAQVRVARRDYPCDERECAAWTLLIKAGDRYAYVSTGLRFCAHHFTDDHIEEYHAKR